jgi:hypothetical protein
VNADASRTEGRIAASAASGREVAADQLGGWRFGARGELRALPRLLRGDERVLGMALGTIGTWSCRLFVATDSRLLLVSKPKLRRARCTEYPYEEIQVSNAIPTGGVCELRLVASGERQTWHLMSAERGERFARLLAARSEPAAPLTPSAIADDGP